MDHTRDNETSAQPSEKVSQSSTTCHPTMALTSTTARPKRLTEMARENLPTQNSLLLPPAVFKHLITNYVPGGNTSTMDYDLKNAYFLTAIKVALSKSPSSRSNSRHEDPDIAVASPPRSRSSMVKKSSTDLKLQQ